MVGDISFAILAIPTEFARTCYRKSMFYYDNSVDLETENSQGTATPPAEPAAPSLKRAAEDSKRGQESVCFPKKSSSDKRPSRPRTRADQVGQRVQANAQPDAYQIWYPPLSAYSDEEDNLEAPGPGPRPPNHADTNEISSEVTLEQKALDEWRQYPAFPSAYPPTPVVVSSATLPSTSGARMQPLAGSLMLSEILEDVPQQDFSQSLLPPRKPLNPGFVDDLSDNFPISGVQTTRLDEMSVDSGSEDDEDDEDIFNTTLQTPMPPLRATRSGIIPVLPINREISMASSVASRSSTLTTNARDSPLRTQSSSESLSSDALSMSDLSSVLGKKRPLPLDVLDVNTKSQLDSGRNRPRGASRANRHIPAAGTSRIEIGLVGGDTQSTYSSADSINDRKPAHPKRRKVSQTPKRVNPAVQPTRTRIARSATVPTKAPIPKPPKPPSSSRAAPGPASRMITRRTENSSDATQSSSSSSIDSSANQTTKPSARSVVDGKSQKEPPRPPFRAI
ncbi:hypothetical protein DXG01_001570 [Tephrocybe rancida]|nr:hypothetical protein DXG01_001570 [Tephrocybe rancida]